MKIKKAKDDHQHLFLYAFVVSKYIFKQREPLLSVQNFYRVSFWDLGTWNTYKS